MKMENMMERKDISENEMMCFGYGVVIGQLQHISLLVDDMLKHQWLGDESLPRELIGNISQAIDTALESLISSKIHDVGDVMEGTGS